MSQANESGQSRCAVQVRTTASGKYGLQQPGWNRFLPLVTSLNLREAAYPAHLPCFGASTLGIVPERKSGIGFGQPATVAAGQYRPSSPTQ